MRATTKRVSKQGEDVSAPKFSFAECHQRINHPFSLVELPELTFLSPWKTTSHNNMTHGSVNITLLPIKMTNSSETLSDPARRRHRKTPSNTRRVGVFECLGLASLAIMVLYEASPVLYTSIQSLLSLHEDIRDFLLGAMLVTALILGRMLLQPYSDAILEAVAHQADESAKRLTRVVSSGSKLSQLSVWKSTSNLAAGKGSHNLSASECFVSLQLIEKLSLIDVTRVLEYAVIDKNKDKSKDDLAKDDESTIALKQVLEAMKRAVREARGPDMDPATAGIDALLLCAALRIFAEWRLLRQVPKSFNKGYQMGMNLGRRDLIQNISKVETAVHQYLQQDNVTTSPSLQQLLEYEVSQSVHSSLPKLNNESAAMGLLWAKRQVDYQACVYANLLDESKFKDTHASLKAAYKQVFDPYHGWWIQQMFSQSYRSAPPTYEIFKLLTKDVIDTTSASSTDETLPTCWSESSCSSFDEGNTSEVSFQSQDIDSSFYRDSARAFRRMSVPRRRPLGQGHKTLVK